MGIFAKGSQFPANVEADTPQNRYGDQFTKDSAAGEALGEVIGEVNAKAESSNETTGAIIEDIEALEGRVDALEGAPLLLHWDGTGTRPTLKPGWALLNTNTGVVETAA